MTDWHSTGYAALSILSTYDQSLALLGLGIAFAQTGKNRWALNLAALAGGILTGFLGADGLLSALILHIHAFKFILPMGAICCAIAGLCLVAPERLRAFLLPLAGFLTGANLAMTITLLCPDADDWLWFASAGTLTGLLVPAIVIFLVQRFKRPWFKIAGRIFGAWLMAIGIMLGAAEIKPKPPLNTAPIKIPSVNLNKA